VVLYLADAEVDSQGKFFFSVGKKTICSKSQLFDLAHAHVGSGGEVGNCRWKFFFY
jgi:hypothetical protein